MYNNVEKTALAAATLTEPTIIIEKNGIMLKCGLNYIYITPAGISMKGTDITLETAAAIIKMSPNSIVIGGPAMVGISSEEVVEIDASNVTVTGETVVDGTLAVSEALTALSIEAGA